MRLASQLFRRMAEVVQLSKPRRHVLLTGQPGVGKTTLIKKVCDKLEEMNFECQGFYTEEIREDEQRVGFDVITLNDGKRGPLARIVDRDNPVSGRSYMVGRYNVKLQSFEQIALPALAVKPEESTRLVVVDEIGKMELFSQSFIRAIKELFKHPRVSILGTIPAPGRANPFVEEIRHRDDTFVYTVTKENRHELITEVVDAVKDSIEEYGS